MAMPKDWAMGMMSFSMSRSPRLQLPWLANMSKTFTGVRGEGKDNSLDHELLEGVVARIGVRLSDDPSCSYCRQRRDTVFRKGSGVLAYQACRRRRGT